MLNKIYEKNIGALGALTDKGEGFLKVNTKTGELTYRDRVGTMKRKMINALHNMGLSKTTYDLAKVHGAVQKTFDLFAAQVGKEETLTGRTLNVKDLEVVHNVFTKMKGFIQRIPEKSPLKHKYTHTHTELGVALKMGNAKMTYSTEKVKKILRGLQEGLKGAKAKLEKYRSEKNTVPSEKRSPETHRRQTEVTGVKKLSENILPNKINELEKISRQILDGDIITALPYEDLSRQVGTVISNSTEGAREFIRIDLAAYLLRSMLETKLEKDTIAIEEKKNKAVTIYEEFSKKTALIEKEVAEIEHSLVAMPMQLAQLRQELAFVNSRLEQKERILDKITDDKQIADQLGSVNQLISSKATLEDMIESLMQGNARIEEEYQNVLSKRQQNGLILESLAKAIDTSVDHLDLIKIQTLLDMPIDSIKTQKVFIETAIKELGGIQEVSEHIAKTLNEKGIENDILPGNAFTPMSAQYWLNARLS